MGIAVRDSVRGKEYIFRHDGKLYVFKSKNEAQNEYERLVNGSLF